MPGFVSNCQDDFDEITLSQPTTTDGTASAPSVCLADLKRKSVRGGLITFASQGTGVAIQLTSTIILARLLTPDDYGVMAMVVAVTAFAGLFRDLGLSSAAIQKQNLTRGQQSNLFWINVTLGCTLTLLLLAVSPVVAWFYQKPEVRAVMATLSATFLIGSVSAQSAALLVREMRFGRQAAAGIAGALVTLALSVTLAFQGFRYWSLVWGQLAGAVTTTTLLFVLSPFRPTWPGRGTGVREMLRFGANITGYDFVNYFARNLDSVLIGRFWGAEALGFYSRAYALLMFPIYHLRGPINAVAFPAMSRLLDQPGAYRAYYRRITSLLALVAMPLSAFLFVAAGPVIALVLGPQWAGVTPIFTLLAAVSFVQPVITLWGMVAISSGLTRRYFWLGVFNTAFTLLAFGVGLPWGAVGVAAAYAVVTYILAWPTLVWAFKGTPVGMADFISSVASPAIGSIAALLVCLCIRPLLATGAESFQSLVLAAVFAASYMSVMAIIPEGRRTLSGVRELFPRTARGAG